MKVLYINTEHKAVTVIDIKPELGTYYKMIDTDMIEMPDRLIGNKRYTIICDEEGTFRDDPKISAIDSTGNPMLVGNLIIVNMNEDEGTEEALTDGDIKYIKQFITINSTRQHPEGLIMINCMSY